MIRLEKAKQAADAIRDRIVRTPLVYSSALSHRFDANIYLKLENFQITGSFKIRGATYKMITLGDKIGAKGVVAASAGNHAQGVALAARDAHKPATIVMPEWASITKQESTRAYGGKIQLSGQSIEDSLEDARKMAEEGMTLIHPFEDPDIIAGQGTIALEIFDDLPDPDMILVPVGGGGLIAGVASIAKSLKPDTRVVGVQAGACPSAYASHQKQQIVSVDAKTSIADGINVRRVGKLNFDIIQKHVDDFCLVEEEHIAEAMLALLEDEKIPAEGAGAVPLAALSHGAVKIPGGHNIVLLISGGNVDSPLVGRIINQGMVKNGRLLHIYVFLSDTPGALAGLLSAIAWMKANVLHIIHERSVRGLPMNVSGVELELETRSAEHGEGVVCELKDRGYDVEIR